MQGPYVTLVPTPKSHHFEERRIKVGPENEAVKIGRAVGRIQPTPENAVFDCKVLSRNHAVLWCENGEFYLKDTKSSNGTFVNNEKLQSESATVKDADTRKMTTGDIIQFGVEIVENTNKGFSVAYGCIYAVIQLYNADGKLIDIGNSTDEFGRSNGTLVSHRKLFQMQQYVSEATYRERIRDDKIAELMSIIEANEQAAETAWKALVNEDRLLARIEALEAQLSVYSNNNNPDKQKEDLLVMIDEKTKFEAMTKEVIRRLQEEIGETASRLKDMERSLDTTETMCQQLRSSNADLENILAETTEMYDQKVGELDTVLNSTHETQRALTACEEKLQDVQQKYLKLSKISVAMETATALSKLLSNALNGGSIIEEQELHNLVDAMTNANYLPSHGAAAAATRNNDSISEDDSKKLEKNVESYLKEILDLQSRNRDLETELAASEEAVQMLKSGELNGNERYEIMKSHSGSPMRKDDKQQQSLEISPTKNISFEPFVGRKQQSVDRIAPTFFLLSLIPFFAIILSFIAPLHNRFIAEKPANSVEKSERKDVKKSL